MPFELYKPQLGNWARQQANESSVPFELYKPQPDSEIARIKAEIKCAV